MKMHFFVNTSPMKSTLSTHQSFPVYRRVTNRWPHRALALRLRLVNTSRRPVRHLCLRHSFLNHHLLDFFRFHRPIFLQFDLVFVMCHFALMNKPSIFIRRYFAQSMRSIDALQFSSLVKKIEREWIRESGTKQRGRLEEANHRRTFDVYRAVLASNVWKTQSEMRA